MTECNKCNRGFMTYHENDFRYKEYISANMYQVTEGKQYNSFCSNVLCDKNEKKIHVTREYISRSGI